MDEIDRWVKEEAETLARCRVFDVERWRLRRVEPEKRADFFVIDAPDWVNVVALNEDGDVLLVEQWRYAVRHPTLEIPGGMVDPGETPAEAAARELTEETGYEAETIEEIGVVEPNPAILTNRCHTFLARDCVKTGEPEFDANERCLLHLAPWPEVLGMVGDGRITHSLVVAALFHAHTGPLARS